MVEEFKLARRQVQDAKTVVMSVLTSAFQAEDAEKVYNLIGKIGDVERSIEYYSPDGKHIPLPILRRELPAEAGSIEKQAVEIALTGLSEENPDVACKLQEVMAKLDSLEQTADEIMSSEVI